MSDGERDRDGEADRHRGERAAPTGPDRGPPGGQDHQAHRETDPEGLAGRRIGRKETDQSRDRDPEQEADDPEEEALADR